MNRIDTVLTVILDTLTDANQQRADGGVGESTVRA
jgi:hypothetical protein